MAVRVNSGDFTEKVLKASIPVLVDFYTDSCIACKQLSPTLGDVEDNYEGVVAVYKVNAGADQELAAEYSVMSAPTLILFKNGEEAGRLRGNQKYADIENFLKERI